MAKRHLPIVIRQLALVLALALAFLPACTQQSPPPDLSAPLDGRGGGFIAFHSFRDGNSEIYVMNADGSGPRRLTSSAGEDSCPDFAPDASRIIFTSERDGNAEIYVMNRDGSEVRRLTQTAAKEMHPIWTRDGQRIVYAREGDLWVMAADGSGQTQITHDLRAELPCAMPDGQTVMFSDLSAGNYDVYVVSIDGSGLRPVAASAEMEVYGRPAPTGNRLALMRGGRTIYAMNLDGSGAQRLAQDAENPSWAPDGLGIAFHSTRTGNYEIYRMDADGRNVTNLSRNAANDFWPTWARIK